MIRAAATAPCSAALAALLLAASPAAAQAETLDGGAGADDPRVAAILALDADLEYGAYLSSECTACHAGDGGGDIPAIRGQDEAALIAALLDYKDGARSHDVMTAIAGRLGEEEIAALAAQISGAD